MKREPLLRIREKLGCSPAKDGFFLSFKAGDLSSNWGRD
jgi:hypothetical protein